MSAVDCMGEKTPAFTPPFSDSELEAESLSSSSSFSLLSGEVSSSLETTCTTGARLVPRLTLPARWLLCVTGPSSSSELSSTTTGRRGCRGASSESESWMTVGRMSCLCPCPCRGVSSASSSESDCSLLESLPDSSIASLSRKPSISGSLSGSSESSESGSLSRLIRSR